MAEIGECSSEVAPSVAEVADRLDYLCGALDRHIDVFAANTSSLGDILLWFLIVVLFAGLAVSVLGRIPDQDHKWKPWAVTILGLATTITSGLTAIFGIEERYSSGSQALFALKELEAVIVWEIVKRVDTEQSIDPSVLDEWFSTIQSISRQDFEVYNRSYLNADSVVPAADLETE